MDKKSLSERDICTKFITPAIQQAGWQQHEFREEVQLTDGRVMVRGNLAARIKNPEVRGGPKRADYVLYARSGVPVAVVEAKQAKFSVGHGMQQALAYAEMLDAPFAISSNGDGFLLHDRTGLTQPVERVLALEAFPSSSELSLLAEHGLPLDILQQAVANGDELDAFDLVAHVAFDQTPLTRRERANQVKKRNVFGQYGDQARAVLETLLEKFVDHGVQDIEDAKVLELPPFDQFGSKTQIRRGIFGRVERYAEAVQVLEHALYELPEQKTA